MRILLALSLILALGCSPASETETAAGPSVERGRCADYDPLRRPLFGDLHIHTSFSMDAFFSGNWRHDPSAAYDFARGEPLEVASTEVRLRRPLDFAAVTDHAEFLGELRICLLPDHPAYDAPECEKIRTDPHFAASIWFDPLFAELDEAAPERFDFCRDHDCLAVTAAVWDETRRAAAEAYDDAPSCAFTSFVAYEWTYMPGGAHTHRNVIFKDATVPELPFSFFEAPTKEALWDALVASCKEATTGCDVLAIPHNTNVSLGLAFRPETTDGTPLDAAAAARRAALEPLVEVVQNKGISECRPGVGTEDELCDFELLPNPYLVPQGEQPPFEPLSFVRNALLEGLLEHERIGINPFRLGMVGGTDTHSSLPGSTREDDFAGAFGEIDGTLERRIQEPYMDANPGGLTVAWAEENSRGAIFDALARREVYATSGTRLVVRFFGGFDLPEDLCMTNDFARRGYAAGVPMGGELTRDGADATPRLAISALQDPGLPDAPGAPLERIQIIKGWVEDGEAREAVLDVAGEAGSTGSESLCTVWNDPDFDAAAPAFYYARVLEVPTLRWHALQCRSAGVDCEAGDTIPPGFENCCDPRWPQTIQERAWTSPIWYVP